MNAAVQEELSELFDRAELAGACVVPQSEAIARRLSRRVDSGIVVRPFRGLYARADYWQSLEPDERLRHIMRACREAHDNWVFCSMSAAVAYRLYVGWNRCHLLDVQIPHRSRRRNTAGVVWHTVQSFQSYEVDGMRVTSIDRTAVDCLRVLPFCEGLGIADSWIRNTGKTREDLIQLVDQMAMGCKGVANARNTVLYADGNSENGGDSYARAVMIEMGFAQPKLQVEIQNPVDSSHVARVDFLWDLPNNQRIIGELDGLVKYTDPSAMDGLDAEQVRARERLRESRLSMPGTSVMRFSIKDVLDRPRFAHILRSYGVPMADGDIVVPPHRSRFEHVRCGEFDVRAYICDRR